VDAFFLAVYALVFRRYERTHDPRLLVAFPILMVVWANLHGGFALGIGYLAVMLAGHALEHRLGGVNELGLRELRHLAFTLAVTIAATAINPSGLREVVYPLVWLYLSAYANLLSEWLSVDFHQFQFMVFEALLLILLAAGIISHTRPRWPDILLIVAFTHLALSQGRNVAVWSVLISPLVAAYARDAISAQRSDSAPTKRERRQVSERRGAQLNLLLLAVVCLAYPVEAAHYITPSSLQTAEADSFPVNATRYLETHTLAPNVFAPYTWGGYVVWKTGRRYHDFIDGRANTLFDAKILNAYLLAYNAQPQWSQIFAHYHVDTVLVSSSSPLVTAISNTGGWRRAYGDDQATVFERMTRG
jgi:hypothetical protein